MISIVIPVYNEASNLGPLHADLQTCLKAEGIDHEILFVDDGSTDDSLTLLKTLAKQNPRVKVISLSNNFGQSAALSAGIHAASGDVLMTMDADRQNDPRDIPLLLEAMRQTGCDIVSGWRKDRKDPFLTRILPSKIANGLISSVTKVKLHDYGCTLKAYRASVIKNIPLYGELHRFLPALASWQGAAIREIPVRHHARKAGKSKYGLARTSRVLFDLFSVQYFLSYDAKPMHFFGQIGFFLMAPGFLIASWITFQRIFFHADISPRIPSLIFCAISILAGFQILMLGLLADIIIRATRQTKKETAGQYPVRETFGF